MYSMLNYIYVVSTYSEEFKDNALTIVSLISIFFGILVIISKNPIISVLFLISLFLSVSFYLMLLGLNFLGISYLLVYIGAVSILFLFILMLINVRVSELLSETYNSIVLSIIIAFSFNISVSNIFTQNIYNFNKFFDNNNYFSLFNMNYKFNDKDNIILRDLSLKVKYVTFNHYDTGSNPVDLLKKSLLLIEQISCNYIIYKK